MHVIIGESRKGSACLFQTCNVQRNRTSRAGCPGPFSFSFWISPKKRTSQQFWAICTSAPPSTQYSSASLKFRGKFPCCSLCPLPLVLSRGTTEKSLALLSLHLHRRYTYAPMSFILNLFPSRFTSPSSLNLSLNVKWSSPLTELVALHSVGAPHLSSTEEPRGQNTPGLALPVLRRLKRCSTLTTSLNC